MGAGPMSKVTLRLVRKNTVLNSARKNENCLNITMDVFTLGHLIILIVE